MAQHYYPGREILEGVSLGLFSKEDLRAIDYATMEVLQNPGIQVSDAEARQIFKEAGCLVDEKTKVVKIPQYLVRKALSCAPARFTLYGRDKKNTFAQEHLGKVHWTCFGTGIKMCNYQDPTVSPRSIPRTRTLPTPLNWWTGQITSITTRSLFRRVTGLERGRKMSMRCSRLSRTPQSTSITLIQLERTLNTIGNWQRPTTVGTRKRQERSRYSRCCSARQARWN